MARWRMVAGIGLLVTVLVPAGPMPADGEPMPRPAQSGGALDPAYLDKLLAPVALYPDQLLAQMLLCSGNARKVGELSAWLRQTTLKGSELQHGAEQAGFEPSFVALAPFPQVVDFMAGNLTWTSQLGGAFAVDRGAVFDSIQRLRKQSQIAGNLKSTPQQTVETKTTQGGDQVIVIEPANPQVVYVPQYNPQIVYTQPTSTTIVVQEDDDDEAAAAVIGFAAGIAIGAAIDNNYYYGPYGWRGGAYMYNDGWDDWYDDREDAREDWYENREDAREDWSENREDMAGERSERAEDAREQRTERAEGAGEQRTERQEARGTPEAQAQREQRRTEAQGRAQEARGTGTTEQARATTTSAPTERGSGERSRTSAERSGTRSDAFSGYSSGGSTRAASSRGERSRSGGGRSRRR
jgi:Protein of unknown function (DUF3300)